MRRRRRRKIQDDIIMMLPAEPIEIIEPIIKDIVNWFKNNKGIEMIFNLVRLDDNELYYCLEMLKPPNCTSKQEKELVRFVFGVAEKKFEEHIQE